MVKQPPATEDEVIDLLTESRGLPIDGEKTYINWQNDAQFDCMAERLRNAWLSGGPDAFVSLARCFAREICEEAFARDGFDPDRVTQRHIDATVVRTLWSPDSNVGTMSDFIGGTFGEIRRVIQLVDADYMIVDATTLARPESQPAREREIALEVNDALGLDEPASVYKQETLFGWDIVAVAPDGIVETEQVKTTSDRPSWKASKEYDRLVWVHDGTTEVKNGPDEEWITL